MAGFDIIMRPGPPHPSRPSSPARLKRQRPDQMVGALSFQTALLLLQFPRWGLYMVALSVGRSQLFDRRQNLIILDHLGNGLYLQILG